MLILAPITFTSWKLIKRTSFIKPAEADLVWERPIVDAYEESFFSPPLGFWTELVQLCGVNRKKKDRQSSIAAY
jgi:yeast amino acid transporter